MIFIILGLMLSSINFASAGYYWNTVKTVDITSSMIEGSLYKSGSCCGNVYEISASYDSTGATIRMKDEANSWGDEWAESHVKYMTSNAGNPYGFSSTGGTYRGSVTFILSGVFDGGTSGTTLLLEVKLYYVDGTTPVPVATGTYQQTSSNQNYASSTITVTTPSATISTGYIYVQVYMKLRAATPTFSWEGESPITHDFWDGANSMRIDSVRIDRYDYNPCPPIC